MSDFDFTQLKGRMAQAGRAGHVELTDMERNVLITNAMEGGGGGGGEVDTDSIVDGAVTSPKIADSSVTTRKLSNGSITIEKFAEKEYAPESFSGLGQKYLRKNISGDKNVLTSAMVSDANTIYHIQYDYDLNGQTLTIPEGCILEFDGGSISNGVIKGAKMNTSFVYTPEMFGAGTTEDDTQAIQNAVNICRNIRLDGNYHVKSIPGYETPSLAAGRAYQNPCIIVPSDTDIEINGKVELTTQNQTSYALFSLYVFYEEYLVKNVRIHGQGVLVGDRDTNTSTTGEHGQGIAIGGYVENISVEGLEFEKMWGDGLVIRTLRDKNRNVNIDGVYIHNCRRQGISITQGDGITISNFRIEDINGTAPQCSIDIENESGEDYGIGSIVIRNGYIRSCQNGLVCNATAKIARSILVENVDADKFIQGHKNTVIRGCNSPLGYVELFDNCIVDGCIFSSACISNTSSDVSIIRNSQFEGLRGTGINAEISDSTFNIHNYDDGTNYEYTRILYLTPPSSQDNSLFMRRCSVLCDVFTTIPHFCSLQRIECEDSIFTLPSPRNLLNVILNKCKVKYTRAISNGLLNKNAKYYSCSVWLPNTQSHYPLYDLQAVGAGDIYVIGCLIYSNITSPRSKVYGTESNYIHDTGTKYLDMDGADAYPTYGTTATRTSLTFVEKQAGFQYFDTTLGKMIVWNGTAWVNMDGTALS